MNGMRWLTNDPLAAVDLQAADAAYEAGLKALRALRLPIPEHAREVKRLRIAREHAYSEAGRREGDGERVGFSYTPHVTPQVAPQVAPHAKGGVV